MVYQVFPDQQVYRARQGHRGPLEAVGLKVAQEPLVARDSRVLMEPQVLPALRVSQDPMDNPDLKDLRVIEAPKDKWVFLAPQDHQDLLVYLVK